MPSLGRIGADRKGFPKCEGFECKGTNSEVVRCTSCDSMYCQLCWGNQGPHRPGKTDSTGLPHEQTDERIYQLLKPIFHPAEDKKEISKLHIEDQQTTWFGVEKNKSGNPLFQDHGRYAALMSETKQPSATTRFPQLVSFVGQTGAGKSTIIKMLISLQAQKPVSEQEPLFKSPVVGSVKDDNSPTSGDVHLYIDPGTAYTPLPLMYADCEGLDGGEVPPRASEFKEPGQNQGQGRRQRFKSSPRELLFAMQNSEVKNRGWAVKKLYPRLLYTFSDVVVFVLQNPRIFEAAALPLLLQWASTSLESSLSQPSLPHAILVLNATDTSIDEDEWDPPKATKKMMERLKQAVYEDQYLSSLAEEWRRKERPIKTTIDLIRCYYSSINVVRVPKKGRYMLAYNQIDKLQRHIKESCEVSRRAKSDTHMLSTVDELNIYLQAGFDHFTTQEDMPFNFVQVALRNNPIPYDFGDHILGFAVKIQKMTGEKDGRRLFEKLSCMVATSIFIDCTRQKYPCEPAELFDSDYAVPCTAALQNFCNKYWPCSFVHKDRACAAVKNCHSLKGHQDARGKVIKAGSYVSSFDVNKFEPEWKRMIKGRLRDLDKLWVAEKAQDQDRKLSDTEAAYNVQQRSVESFWASFSHLGAESFTDPTRCFCCLMEAPQHPLPCGHILCTPCLKAYGDQDYGKAVQIRFCPLHKEATSQQDPWLVHFKPDYAGVRILTLDGGGIRGIVELEVLRAIEKALGAKLCLGEFFDLIIGTSTGGIIALGLGCKQWSLEYCINKFKQLCDEAFTPRAVPGFKKLSMLHHGSRYKTKPLRKALQKVFGTDRLYGGPRKDQASYNTKVAVTATSGTGEQGLILANYSRQEEGELGYRFEFPNDLAIWEAASATSAAPSYFKPFEKQGNLRRMYLDGAIYYNNPARVANHERRLLWPDVADRHPDILLSVGTGRNGRLIEEDLRAEKDIRSTMQMQLSNDSSKGTKFFKPVFHVAKWFELLATRIDVILDVEREWKLFCADTLDGRHGDDNESRYLRLNVDLGKDPPTLDDKSSLSALQDETTEILRRPEYQVMIEKISHQLIASTFYFVKEEVKPDEAGSNFKGKITCRFEGKSARNLGDLLERQKCEPFFSIKQNSNEPDIDKIVIDPEKFTKMADREHFSIDTPVIKLPTNTTPIVICLNLCCTNRKVPEPYPISGFPRYLALEDEENAARLKKRAQHFRTRQPRRFVVGTNLMPAIPNPRTPTTPSSTAKRNHPRSAPRALSNESKIEAHSESAEMDKRKHVETWPAGQPSEKEQMPIRPRSLSELMDERDSDNDGGAVPLVDAEKLGTRDMVAMMERLRLPARNESDLDGDETDRLLDGEDSGAAAGKTAGKAGKGTAIPAGSR